MISLRKIAKIADVSVATVSYVLKNKINNIPLSQQTIDKVWQVVKDTKYRPNNDIGIFSSQHGLTQLYQQVFTGVYEEAVKNNLKVTGSLKPIRETPDFIDYYSVGGVVILDGADETLCEICERKSLPYIIVNPETSRTRNCILCDDRLGMRKILDHFYKSPVDYREFIYITHQTAHQSRHMRQDEYRDYVREKNLTEFIYEAVSSTDPCQFFMDLLESHERPAFVFDSEELIVSFLRAAAYLKKSAPKDFGLISINDEITRQIKEPISALRIPFYEMGSLAIKTIIDKWETGNYVNESITVEPELIIR